MIGGNIPGGRSGRRPDRIDKYTADCNIPREGADYVAF